jgi:hypothetical protein
MLFGNRQFLFNLRIGVEMQPLFMPKGMIADLMSGCRKRG